MGEAGLRLRRSHWARDGTGLRLWTLPSDRAHVYPDVQDLEQPWRMAVPTPRDAPGPTPGHGGPAALRGDGVLAGPDLEFRAFRARRGLPASSALQLERAWDAWQAERYQRGETGQRPGCTGSPFRPR